MRFLRRPVSKMFQANVEFQVRLLDGGDAELRFVFDGNTMELHLNPQQLGIIATQLLSTASTSHRYNNPVAAPAGPMPIPLKLEAMIPVTNWYFADPGNQQSKVVAIQVGATVVGFSATEDQLRGLARTMLKASWRVQSALPLMRLLWETFRDFGFDIRGWVGVFSARLKASSLRCAISFSSWISGRSLRVFRTIVVSPTSRVPQYPAANKCIYCDALVYSTKPGIRRHPLGAEHIIAEGIGGTIEIPLASCQECEDSTGRLVEGDVFGRTMKALRVHLKLKKKGSGPPPKTLPISAKIEGQDKTIEIPVEDYPIIFMMGAYEPPRVGGEGGMLPANGLRFVNLRYDEKMLYLKHGISAFSTPVWDNHMVIRMLAKVGHSLAVAELSRQAFRPMLLDLICSGDVNAMKLVGGEQFESMPHATDSLHELDLGYQRIEGATYVVAKIRLFANQGGPAYRVIVGSSLEAPIARFMRVLSSKISTMLAR
jgi:hypothetical protein